MSEPRDYVPSEFIVRSTVDVPIETALTACPVRPWTTDAWLHVAECGACQAMLDADVGTHGGYNDTLAYIPAEELVSRVLLASMARRYRVRLLDDLIVNRVPQRSLGGRVAASLGALALSPSVLAAAVVVHAAVVVALAGVTVFSVKAPERRVSERVEYSPLGIYRASLPGMGPAQRTLASSVAQEMTVGAVLGGFSSAELVRLDSTAAGLRHDRAARVLIGAQDAREALTAAELIGRYLIVHGVSRSQVKIVAGGASAGQVTVSLDTLARLP